MLKELFAVGEVVAPDADAFAQSGFIGFNDGLVIEFIEPLVNGAFNVFSLVVGGVKNFEPRVRLGRNLFKEYALGDFALFYRVLFSWTDNWDACLFLD